VKQLMHHAFGHRRHLCPGVPGEALRGSRRIRNKRKESRRSRRVGRHRALCSSPSGSGCRAPSYRVDGARRSGWHSLFSRALVMRFAKGRTFQGQLPHSSALLHRDARGASGSNFEQGRGSQIQATKLSYQPRRCPEGPRPLALTALSHSHKDGECRSRWWRRTLPSVMAHIESTIFAGTEGSSHRERHAR